MEELVVPGVIVVARAGEPTDAKQMWKYVDEYCKGKDDNTNKTQLNTDLYVKYHVNQAEEIEHPKALKNFLSKSNLQCGKFKKS